MDGAGADDAAFRDALIAAIPRLRRLAHRLTPPPQDADDLVQDVLERAWRSRASFRADAALTTWLHRVLVNRAIDLHRSSARDPSPSGGDLTDLADPADFEVLDPAALLDRATDVAHLRAALARLTPQERTVLALHDGEGWTARVIGTAVGLPANTVHKRLQRARVRLARELAGADGRAHTPAAACRRVRGSATGYLAGTLEPAARAVVAAHIRTCPRCPALVQALLGLPDVLGRSPGPEDPGSRLRWTRWRQATGTAHPTPARR